MDISTSGYSVHIVGIAIILYIVYSIYDTLRKPSSKVPGPWYTKWTRLVLEFYWIRGRRAYWVDALHKKYGKSLYRLMILLISSSKWKLMMLPTSGPVVRIAPDYIDFLNIDALNTIYTSKETYRKSDWYSKFAVTVLPSIFNTTNVDLHRRFRRLLAGPMAESSLKNVVPQITARVDMAIAAMQRDMNDSGVVDVYKWWLFMATDIIGELTFGESFQMLEQGKTTQYVTDLQDLPRLGAIRSVFPWIPSVAPYLPFRILTRVTESPRRLVEYGIQSLNRYRALMSKDPHNVTQTLFMKLFTAQDDETMKFEEILGNAQEYIVAGSDTTAHTLTYLVWSVCRHPRVMSRLVKELQTLPEDFTESDLRGLPYLGNVITETLRLYSPAPSGLPRVIPNGGAEIDGYWLKQGTVVCSQAFSLHRNPKVFQNPESFDPSRWESATQEMKSSFMPFGKGARACIGSNLAKIELRLATARFFLLYPNARVSTKHGMCDADMKPVIYFLMGPAKHRCLIDKS